jgi:hypothetical protein
MNGTTGGHRRPARRRSRQAGVLAAAAAGVAVLAAACGSGGSSPAGPAPSHPPGYQQYHAYSQCMRSHGAPFWPGPSQVPQGVWDNPNTYKITPRILAQEHGPGWQAALTACQKVAPTELPYTAAHISALRTQLLKLAACMRTHGITHFPSPVTGPYGAGFPSPGPGVKPDSARFQAAQRTCWADAPRA